MLLNNYANTINQSQQQEQIPIDPIDNTKVHKNNSRGLSRLLCLNNNNCNNDNNNNNSFSSNPSFSTILFFILILLILFFFNNNNNT